MKKLIRFNLDIKNQIVTLASDGRTQTEIAEIIGISPQKLSRWIKQHKLKPILEKYREKTLSDSIEQGLIRLSKGYETTEVTKEYYKEEPHPDRPHEILKVKVKTKVTKVAPDIKAIQVLAKKYNQEFSDKKEIDINHTHLHLDSNQISLRELQALRNPIEAEYKKLKEGGALEELGYTSVDSDLEDVSVDVSPPSEEI